MAYLISHHFAGGTQEQYEAILGEVHPGGKLPAGQTYHVAGPTDGGWLIAAVWNSKEDYDRFVSEKLEPALGHVSGGFSGPPEMREAQVANQVSVP